MGEWEGAGLLAEPTVLTSLERHCRASASPVEIAVFGKVKIWGLGSHRGLHPKPAYGTRAAALFLMLLAGRLPSPLGTFSRLVLTPSSPSPSPSGTSCGYVGVPLHLCSVSASLPKPACLLAPGHCGRSGVLVSCDPLHPPHSIIPFTALYQERRAGRNREMNNL